MKKTAFFTMDIESFCDISCLQEKPRAEYFDFRIEKAIGDYENSRKSAEQFISLIDKYQNFDIMTNTMLNEFVEKILVHERDRKWSKNTTQEVEIYFNFIGKYIPPTMQTAPLTPEEQEGLRKCEERRSKMHQYYLRYKTSGTQQEYDQRYGERHKAKIEAEMPLSTLRT